MGLYRMCGYLEMRWVGLDAHGWWKMLIGRLLLLGFDIRMCIYESLSIYCMTLNMSHLMMLRNSHVVILTYDNVACLDCHDASKSRACESICISHVGMMMLADMLVGVVVVLLGDVRRLGDRLTLGSPLGASHPKRDVHINDSSRRRTRVEEGTVR